MQRRGDGLLSEETRSALVMTDLNPFASARFFIVDMEARHDVTIQVQRHHALAVSRIAGYVNVIGIRNKTSDRARGE